MAVAVKNCLGVDIGTQMVRIAHLEMGKAGPRVTALLEEALDVEEGLTEAQRFQRISKQIGKMLKEAGLRTRNAVFCIPGQSVFVRQFKLPRATPDRLDRMIRFEARQQIPFPLEKTTMQYQVFEETDVAEVEVLLAAIKREFITNFMRMVNRLGLRAIGISVSSLALYNFHELNLSGRDLTEVFGKKGGKEGKEEEGEAGEPEKGKARKRKGFSLALPFGRKKQTAQEGGGEAEAAGTPQIEEEVQEEPPEVMDFEEIPAYVHIGAHLMDLAVPRAGASHMIGFARSVPLAGNDMDRAIRNKLNLEDFAQARKLKEEKCAVLIDEIEETGQAQEMDQAASEAVTGVADRIIGEIRRSLDFYISQPDGVAVDYIVVSGGLVKMPHLDKYIEERMGVPVELAEMKHPQVRLPEEPPESLASFTVALGLAFQGLSIAQNQIDFLPSDIKKVRTLQRQKAEWISLTLMLAALIGLNVNIGETFISRLQQEAQGYDQQMGTLFQMTQRINEARKLHSTVAQAYGELATAAGFRDFWFDFLTDFHEYRPQEVLIDEIYMRIDGVVIVNGRATRKSHASRTIDQLQQSSELIASAMLSDIQETYDPRFEENPVFDFRLVLRTQARQGRFRAIGPPPPQYAGQ